MFSAIEKTRQETGKGNDKKEPSYTGWRAG
jgi:hypothetical protein